ncbi:MAG TPA: alpha/beta hydrolase [Nevskiaceae bacterium]
MAQRKTSDEEHAQLDAVCAIEVTPGKSLAYGGASAEQRVELYGEDASSAPCVVLVHGGYFRAKYDLAHMRPMAAELGRRGAFVVLAEYRRAGNGGGYPVTSQDIAAMMAFVLRRFCGGAGRARGHRIAVAGHSAGGSLVLTWASHQTPDGPPIALVPLAPVSDLQREANLGLAGGAVLEYLGATPDADRTRYLAEDPRSRAACIPQRIEVTLVHGTADGLVDVAFSRDFPARRRELDGAGHFDLVDPASPYFETVASVLLATA